MSERLAELIDRVENEQSNAIAFYTSDLLRDLRLIEQDFEHLREFYDNAASNSEEEVSTSGLQPAGRQRLQF
tara:strand:- start:91 stop:306 length:216 start_codon:yes stop_codon:yes gene_type:complete